LPSTANLTVRTKASKTQLCQGSRKTLLPSGDFILVYSNRDICIDGEIQARLFVHKLGGGRAIGVAAEADPVGGEGVGKRVFERFTGAEVKGLMFDPIAVAGEVDFRSDPGNPVDREGEAFPVIAGQEVGIRGGALAAGYGNSYTGEHFTFASIANATHVRLEATGSGSFVGLSEFRVRAVPEPSSFALMLLGLGGLYLLRRKS
jgi:hypothetical protein